MKPKAGETSANNGADFLARDNSHQVTAAENIEDPDRHFLVAAQYDSIGIHDFELALNYLVVTKRVVQFCIFVDIGVSGKYTINLCGLQDDIGTHLNCA